jgi:small subunit ribosomal protein S2
MTKDNKAKEEKNEIKESSKKDKKVAKSQSDLNSEKLTNKKNPKLSGEANSKELEVVAEAESLKTEKDLKEPEVKADNISEEKSLKDKKKELLAKVKKLKGKIDVTTTEELKEQVKVKKRADMLIPLEEYVKAGIYLGTKVVTPDMKPFVYRRRADGLAILNTDIINEKLKEGIKYLAQFEPKDVILVCKRQAGRKVAEMFSELTGIRAFTKKYPSGILTNTQLPDFFENELTIITDSWLDKNALNDTVKIRKKVLMICDANNFAQKADQMIIGNNKSAKSLGVIFYLLAKGYCEARGIKAEIPDLEWWTTEEEKKVREKIARVARRTRFGV